ESLKAKLSSTGTGVHKTRKTGRTESGSQRATDDASDSATLATEERLKNLQVKTKSNDVEGQSNRLGQTDEDVGEGVNHVNVLQLVPFSYDVTSCDPHNAVTLVFSGSNHETSDLIAARRERITTAIDLLEESDSLTQVRAKTVQSLKDQLVRTEKWAKDHGCDIQAHHESLKAKISSTGTGAQKKGKTGRTKRDSQAAADRNLRSATADESNSAILATAERLKNLESKTEPKELEEQDKRLGRTEEGVEEGVFEGRANSQ
ncbi:hypothetical protein FRC01_008972, partial [Tulasnella sp. 417]